MLTEPASPLTDRCTATLAAMRADLAARGRRKGPAELLLAAMIGLLETLLAMIADFRAGRLLPLPPPAPGLARSPRPSPGVRADEGEGGSDAQEHAADAAPCPSASSVPPPGSSLHQGGEGERQLRACAADSAPPRSSAFPAVKIPMRGETRKRPPRMRPRNVADSCQRSADRAAYRTRGRGQERALRSRDFSLIRRRMVRRTGPDSKNEAWATRPLRNNI
jgi:hypothetical protein